jgi:hypothetical protein
MVMVHDDNSWKTDNTSDKPLFLPERVTNVKIMLNDLMKLELTRNYKPKSRNLVLVGTTFWHTPTI